MKPSSALALPLLALSVCRPRPDAGAEMRMLPRSGVAERLKASVPVIPTPAAGPAAGRPKTNPQEGIEYVFIPAGRFEMGCVPSDSACDADERPRHTVDLTQGFWLGRTKVTVAAFGRFVAERGYRTLAEREGWGHIWGGAKWEKKQGASWRSPGFRQGDLDPVVLLSWDDAVAYCSWSGGRLATEAEWEYAARGGVEGHVYPWGNGITRENANYGQDQCCAGLAAGLDRWEFTSPVGSFGANGYGLFDMSGNAWEWLSDWYDKDYYGSSPGTDPRGAMSGRYRVLRGGMWLGDPTWLRITSRMRREPGYRSDGSSLRCARDAAP